ncbi:MAG: 5-formyltetrahydrofolate cyclo-ligase [Balneolales bacterium]
MKVDLRKKLLQTRSRLSDAEITLISEKITDTVLGLQTYQNAETVHCYLSINKEISTTSLINNLLRHNKRLVVPRVITGTNRMEHIALKDHDHLKPNAWGIAEPHGGTNVDIQQLDLVLVPMVGGDPKGNRLGYGKGFYDQFLSGVKCPKIGLMPECCLVDQLPVEPHDVKLDMIITENTIFKKKINHS